MKSSFRYALWMIVLSGMGILSGTSGLQVTAADWPQFLGPNRNGISDETGLLDSWPAGGPKEGLAGAGGVGMSASVSDGTACTLVQTDKQQFLLALDAKDRQAEMANGDRS